jgi:hypothetical protein
MGHPVHHTIGTQFITLSLIVRYPGVDASFEYVKRKCSGVEDFIVESANIKL